MRDNIKRQCKVKGNPLKPQEDQAPFFHGLPSGFRPLIGKLLIQLSDIKRFL